MSKKRTKAVAAPDVRIEPSIPTDLWTQIAFVLTLAIAIARGMMSETVRDAFDVVAGGDPSPRGVGPTAALMLDAACCAPALLVLLRRTLDRDYRLRWTWSQVAFALLAVWSACSVAWSADRFIAVVNAANMLAAAA